MAKKVNHLAGVPGRLDLGEYLFHVARLIYEKAGTHDAHVLAPQHVLLLPHPESFAQGPGFIVAQERVGQAVLVLELLVGFLAVCAGTDDCDAQILKVAEFVTEPLGFNGSARCRCFGVEEQ